MTDERQTPSNPDRPEEQAPPAQPAYPNQGPREADRDTRRLPDPPDQQAASGTRPWGQGGWTPPPGDQGGQTGWTPPPDQGGQSGWPPPPADQDGRTGWGAGPGQGGQGAWPPPGDYGGPAPRPKRSFLPIALLVVAGIVAVALFAFLRQADRDEEGVITEGGTVGVLDLAVGDCVADPLEGATEGEIGELTAVVCDQPHDEEVYAVFDLPGGEDAEYAGDDALHLQAEDGCIDRFQEYVGSTYEESALYVTTISPRAGTWVTGDREVVCLVYLPDGQLTGSVRGTGQ